MQELNLVTQTSSLAFLSPTASRKVHFNLPPAELVEIALSKKEGKLTSTGALMADTGSFTGRSPKDRYIVLDDNTKESVWWGDINIPFDSKKFNSLLGKMKAFLADKELFVRDAYAGADENHRLKLKVINTKAWHNLFCYNMFLRPTEAELENFEHDFTIICAPEFEANPEADGTRNPNFAIINLTERIILIGGTGYAGEMKKGIFSVLNFILPHDKNVLSMHCSANMGAQGDTAIFFGLSGTGKTTLSADPNRNLVGDDEHGWTEDGIFNFEGGCYAKVIDLSKEKEPEIWDAIKFGAIVENTRFKENSREVDFTNKSVTENTRTAYPIHFIPNALDPSTAGIPKNIFFLTADAFGVIPPISKLNKSQAMYHFISGYTAKVAGTEMGITEPKLTFSACFGAAFLPLHPTKYATLFGEKMEKYETNVWLINTGWTGGPYGVGSRMKLPYTRAMITAALEGKLDQVEYVKHRVFGLEIPQECPNVPSQILNPRLTWSDEAAYDKQSRELAEAFKANFEKFKDFASEDILKGAPL
ncbi:phosphoenolpyruvate carboxykinase (ATP) [Algoriphagus ratkowskyi]|uniref:Phosphoenolpyruvate carboxykinase (ATP) n=1 Tax=Algoriphagus ratkowskyi TaxID=57028 RepID=A0A2W7SX63_9BACT|nr:phosphoenolpyruvate carboxykinase (ATP) [Algoriphagus ratkowskyi]PZX55412.1 phosphoenolpyruvate carboxykinase (ATP) [Algoriphagus ratkowskyi]TXD79664.1 phosphoenolpyruvate carboxykinase (ATP) [Algoriphagus ratkowskyi]